jgi:hypothetical protein
MSHSSRGPDSDDDLEALVSELETTLSDLRAELAEHERAGRAADERPPRSSVDSWERRGLGRRLPRPPSSGELLRFTSDYTIPTVVAVLEATIEALELFRGVIDLAAPGEVRSRRGRGRGTRRDRRDPREFARTMLSDAVADGVTSATDRATADATDALERLRETLSEADLPEDEESRDLVADARDLSAELERRVRESREAVDRERERERRADRGGDGGTAVGDDDGPVRIAVGEPGEHGEEPDDDLDGDGRPVEDDAPEVDVDAELESIKRQVGKQDADESADADGHGDGDADANTTP